VKTKNPNYWRPESEIEARLRALKRVGAENLNSAVPRLLRAWIGLIGRSMAVAGPLGAWLLAQRRWFGVEALSE